MDPSTIAALSGAPAWIVALYLVIALLKDRRESERVFLRTLKAERRVLASVEIAVRRQSALLLVMIEMQAPGRSEEIERRASRLFEGPGLTGEDDEDREI